MASKIKIGFYILNGLLLVALLVLLVKRVDKKQFIYVKQVDTVLIRDTIKVWMPAKIKYKKIYEEKSDASGKRQTVIREDTSEWIACIDTTIKRTRVEACFFYPKKYFSVLVTTKPDTITKTLYIEAPKPMQKQETWYEKPLIFLGGVGLGLILGLLK